MLLERFAGWARTGFAARGAVYLAMGWYALVAAIGGGRPRDARGTLMEALWQPYGRALLIALAVGFAGHAAWRIAQAVLDIEKHGRDLRGWVLRGAQVVGAAINVALSLFAGTLALGLREPGRPGQDEAQDWSAWLLMQPAGRWIIAIIGISVLGAAAGQLWGAYSLSFDRNLECGPRARRVIGWVGRAGLVANAFVLALIGTFFVSAAWYVDAAESGGFLTALETLWRHPAGPWLVGVVGVGLMAFGLFSLALVFFRRIEQPTDEATRRAIAKLEAWRGIASQPIVTGERFGGSQSIKGE